MTGLPGQGRGWTFADVAALHEALDCATLAALAAEGGDRERVVLALLGASSAAASAFPAGSREAEALGVIFSAIDRATDTPSIQWDVPPASAAEPELGD